MKINHLNLTIFAVMLPWTSSLLLGDVDVTQLPTNGVVVAGEATISQIPSVMTINQGSERASITWDTFNIGSSATVNINQPSISSVLHNLVLDSNPSQIFGQINANGQVFLSNPSGVYFSPTASVNVGGLVATTATISISDFMAGINIFTQNGVSGSVINDGNLEASLGGYIALLSSSVQNNGVIIAQMGTVVLAGGDSYKLQFSGNILNAVEVTASEIQALVENGNAIYAPNGLIILSAQAAHTIQSGIIGNTGVISASGVSENGGVIRLFASQAISNSGEIRADGGDIGDGGVIDIISDLSNPNSQTNIGGVISAKGGLVLGDGGKIETSGSRVFIDDLASISTYAINGLSGTWTIDPNDFTVGVGGNMIGSAVESALLGGNFSIISSNGSTSSGAGDIHINDSISWSANEFSLIAAHSINVNAIMNATGSSTLVMNTSTPNGEDAAIAGGLVNMGFNTDGSFKGQINFDRVGSGFLSIDGNDYTVINNFGLAGSGVIGDFQAMSATGHYALGGNLNAEGIVTTGITAFTGNFNGLGHTINEFSIASGPVNSGLFNTVGIDSVIQNIGLIGGLVEGGVDSGGLIGANAGNVYNSFNTGDVISVYAGQGGLVGNNGTSTIMNSYATGRVEGAAGSGGLVGVMTTGTVSDSYATGEVTGAAGTGGLVGTISTGTISGSYATGNVTGAAGTGGLVGTITGTLQNSYATGNVIGAAGTGGLVGTTTGEVRVSYATGAVDGDAGVGGLIGTTTGLTQNTYATGSVSGDSSAGGLIGSTTAAVENSYSSGLVTSEPLATTGAFIGTATATNSNNFFDSSVNDTMVGVGTTSVIGGVTGLSTEEMKVQGNFTSWDFTDIWMSVSGNMPYLKPLMTPLTLSGDSFTTTYTASAIGGSSTYSITPTSALAGVLSYSYLSDGNTTTTAPINAGSYTVTPTGLLSTQQYLISFASGDMVITPAPLSVSGTNNEVTYTSNLQTNTGASYSGNLGSDTFTINGYATGTNYNATPYADNLSLSGAALSNYDVSYTNGSLAIAKAPLSVIGATTNLTYTGSLQTNTYNSLGLLGSDTVTSVSGLASQTNHNPTPYSDTLSLALGTGLSNYDVSYTNGTLFISKAPLSVSGTNNEVTYTSNLQTNTGASYSGNLGSDTFTINGYATGTNYNATPYADNLSLSGAALSNYDVSYTNGSLAIAKAPLGIFNDTAVYTGSNILNSNNGTFILTGLVGSDIGTTISTATMNSAEVANAEYFTSLTLLNSNQANYRLFAGSNETRNLNTTNSVTLNNLINPTAIQTSSTVSPANNMLITDVINETKLLDYSESFFSGNFSNFEGLPYSNNLKIEESEENNYIKSEPDGRIVIGQKPVI